jgi:hypothetical protein
MPSDKDDKDAHKDALGRSRVADVTWPLDGHPPKVEDIDVRVGNARTEANLTAGIWLEPCCQFGHRRRQECETERAMRAETGPASSDTPCRGS